MSDMSFGDQKLQVVLQREEGRVWVQVRDLAHGAEWRRVPLAIMEVYDKSQFRVDRVETFRIDALEAIGDGAGGQTGVHVILGDTFRRVQVGIWLRVEAGELVVRVPPTEVYESKAAAYRIFTILPLPGLLRIQGGQMLLPLNTGMLCNPAGKGQVADRFMIYGEQYRWELMPMLPVAGVEKTGGGGLVVLATGGAADTECLVSTDGAGGGGVEFGVSLRQNWPDKVDLEQREIRYVPLPREKDVVHFAAKRLRRHVMEDLGKKTLRQRAEESPELKYYLNAYIMKLFFGVENEGIMMYDAPKAGHITFKQVMNFAEAGKLLTKVREAGINQVITQSVGWNPRGHDGLWPTRFPIEERLGGEQGFRALLKHGQALGFHMNAHDNFLSAYRNSPDFDEEHLIQDIYGEPMGLGEWGGGITFIQWALDLPEDRLEGEMRRVKALGLSGVGYADGMGNPLYRNYHPRHRGTRGDYARGVVRIMEALRRVHGAAQTECGFLYAALPSDGMCTPGARWHIKACRPEWPVTALQDKRVPVWQLALQGLIVLENQGHDWKGTMRTVLMGNHPRTEWSAHPGVMPVLDDKLLGVLKARYDLCLQKFGYLQTLEMMEYRNLGGEVRRTKFEDGTEVTADFAKQELEVNGKRVERPAGLA